MQNILVPVVEVRVWGISWKAGQMLLSLPQSGLESTETADSVVQHHGLQKSLKFKFPASSKLIQNIGHRINEEIIQRYIVVQKDYKLTNQYFRI
jgi:hypothetical protein